MKITLFIGGLKGGGAEKVCSNLANYLVENSNEVTILTMAEEEPQYKLDESIQVKSLIAEKDRKGKILDIINRYKNLKNYVIHSDTDVYIVMLPVTTIMLLSLSKYTSAKIIACERNIASSYSLLTKILLKKYASIADGWVFQTTEEKNWYGNRIKDISISIIPNAINKDIENIEINRNVVKNEIITVGRLSKHKNQMLLIKAFATVSERFPNYKLKIFGQGDLKYELQNEIDNLNMSDKIILAGFSYNIYEEIKNSAVFVLPSNKEGIPNALMEAMALGIPCIATDCDGGGAKLLIKNNVNGLLVDKNDEKGLADAISILLEDKNRAENYGREASFVKNLYSNSQIYKRWLIFIREIVNGISRKRISW